MTENSSIQSQIKRWIKEGKGQGSGADYKPWFTPKQVSSRGNTHRPKGIKTGREHLFLSDWENFYFLLLDWSEEVLDVREQFPLLDEHNDIEETVEIAKQLGVEHPIEPNKNTLKVMTTDFLVTFIDGTEVAVSFKPSKLVTEREVEKMEIERIYWERRGVQWELISEKDIPLAFAKNIDYTHSVYNLSDYHISQIMVAKAKKLMEPLIIKRNLKLTEITNGVDDRLGLAPGNSLTIARHLIITKKWVVDMEELIDPNMPLSILQIPVEMDLEVQRRHAN